jgi:hypothetical protein
MQTDHHICIKEETDRLFFFSRTKCDEESGLDMLNIMSKTGKIHHLLWKIHSVIVSPDLLNSLLDAYKNRKNRIITIDQILVTYPINPVSYPDNPQAPVVSAPDNPQRIGKDRIGKETKGYSHDFLKFYDAYPKHKKKDDAWRAWEKRKGDRPTLETILMAITKQCKSFDWKKEDGKYIPYPASWLNAGQWEDECTEDNATKSDAPRAPIPQVPMITCPKCNARMPATDLDNGKCPVCIRKERNEAVL